MQIFVSAIGTEVGKTVASAILTKAMEATYWKPIQSGAATDSDTKELSRLVPGCKQIPEQFLLQAPLSPHIAAKMEGVEIRISDIILPNDNPLVIEGAGGLMVPINDQELMIDLIQHLKIPCVLVANSYLGSINHTLLSVEILRQRGIPLLGVIFKGDNFADNEEIIQKFSGAKVLAHIPTAEELNAEFVNQEAKKLAQILKELSNE